MLAGGLPTQTLIGGIGVEHPTKVAEIVTGPFACCWRMASPLVVVEKPNNEGTLDVQLAEVPGALLNEYCAVVQTRFGPVITGVIN